MELDNLYYFPTRKEYDMKNLIFWATLTAVAIGGTAFGEEKYQQKQVVSEQYQIHKR